MFYVTICFVFFIFILFAYMYYNAKRERLVEHIYRTPHREKGRSFRLFFISDIHRRKLSKSFVERLRNQSIDFVCIGGDFVEGGVPLQRIEQNLQSLRSIGPIFYVWGNNDREVGEDTLRKLFDTYQVVILENETKSLTKDQCWGIAGTDDPSSGRVQVEKTAKEMERYPYILFMAHSPLLFSKIRPYRVPELSLAGHTHGGQIHIGPYAMHPLGRWEEKEGRVTLISNGYGTTFVPLRLKAWPESHLIQVYY